MKISLTRQSACLFEAKNADGKTILIDGPISLGGTGISFRPMELILAGLAGCSAVDILLILQQGKQTVENFNIEVTGQRVDETPAVFKQIDLYFALSGDINEKKLTRAIDLSMQKYCSVAKMLQKSVKINYTHQLN